MDCDEIPNPRAAQHEEKVDDDICYLFCDRILWGLEDRGLAWVWHLHCNRFRMRLEPEECWEGAVLPIL